MAGSAHRLINLEALKSEISEELSISQIAERLCGVDLQRSGNQWQGLCPIHEENGPSFYVNDTRGLFHCFGCKAGGDAIELVRKVRNLGFTEALYLLAAEADIEISNYERPLTEAEKANERLRANCEMWLETVDNGIERTSLAIAQEFGVGISRKNSSVERVEKYLTEGIIFPYRLPSGRLVGWKVRNPDTKKMFGTPGTFPLHEETLFGIQIAREHLEDGRLVLVEGEYDCMAAHQAGLRNVGALGGSALTSGQMELLEGLHVREITVVLDGDNAGEVAAKAIASRYWAHGITVRIAVCAIDEDPDSLITKFGAIAFEMLVRTARHALEYLLWVEWQARPRESLSSKLEFVSWIREHYGAKLRTTDESLVLKEVAKWLEISEIEVTDFVRQNDTSLQATDSERVILANAMHSSKHYVELRKRFSAPDFYMVKHQRLWDILARMLVDGLEFDIPTITRFGQNEGIDPGYIQGLSEVQLSNSEYHEEQVLDMALRRSARDEVMVFKDRISDMGLSTDTSIGELTHKITERVLRKSGSALRQIGEQVDLAMDTLHARMANPTEIHGLDLGTQFPELSRTLQGLQARRLVLLSATSGMGKSTMMLQWSAALAIHQAVPIDFISLEMDEVEILNKIASHMTGIDSMKISGGRLDPQEQKRVEFAMGRIRKSPLHIWAPDGLNSVEFLLYARESRMQRQTEAFFIDYIQLTDPDPGMERENGYTQFGHFGRMAKMKVARAMDVCVVCCAQLKREAAGKERPTKEDMGDSYALVRHSDVIMIISSKDEDSSDIDFWVDKNRQGLGGNVLKLMTYDKPANTFREVIAPKAPEYLVM